MPTGALADSGDAEHVAAVNDVKRLYEAIAGKEAQNDTSRPAYEKPSALLPATETPRRWSQPEEQAARNLGNELGIDSERLNEGIRAVAQGGAEKQYWSSEAADSAGRQAHGDADWDVMLTHAKAAVDAIGPDFKHYLNTSS